MAARVGICSRLGICSRPADGLSRGGGLPPIAAAPIASAGSCGRFIRDESVDQPVSDAAMMPAPWAGPRPRRLSAQSPHGCGTLVSRPLVPPFRSRPRASYAQPVTSPTAPRRDQLPQFSPTDKAVDVCSWAFLSIWPTPIRRRSARAQWRGTLATGPILSIRSARLPTTSAQAMCVG